MNSPVKNNYRTRKTFFIVRIGILAALSFILMLFEFPLPIFPSFLKLDPSQVPVVIGTFSMGPLCGIAILFIKNLLNLMVHSSSLGVGELADFLVGAAFVLVSGFTYKYKKTRLGAILSMCLGTIAAVAAGSILNYYLFLPLYEKFLNFPISAVVAMGNELNPSIIDLKSFIVLAIAPFNLIKWSGITILSALLYKKVSPLLHWNRY